MNDLNMICFLFLARTKNLPKTAKELSLSKNTVIRNIERLEEIFQAELFRKNDTGRVELTTAGEYYYKVCRNFESRLKNTILEMNHPKNNEVLHLAWDSWLGCTKWMKDAICKYADANKELDLRLISDSINEIPGLFERRYVDVVFSSMQMSRCLSQPHHTIRMEEVPVYLAVSENHVLAVREKVTPVFASFVNITVPVGNETEEEAIKRVNEFHVPLGFLPKQIAVYDNWNSVYIDVALGNGICITPENDMLKDNKNIRLIPTGRTVTFAASWVNSAASRHVRPFVDFISMERKKAYE